METESDLADRVENTLFIDPELEPDIPNRNEPGIAPIDHDDSEEEIAQSTLVDMPPIRKRQRDPNDEQSDDEALAAPLVVQSRLRSQVVSVGPTAGTVTLGGLANIRRILKAINVYREFICSYFRIDEHINADHAHLVSLNNMNRTQVVTSRISIENVWQRTEILFRRITTNCQRVTPNNNTEINSLTETVQKLARFLTVQTWEHPSVEFLRRGGLHNTNSSTFLDVGDIMDTQIVELSKEYPLGHPLSQVSNRSSTRRGVFPDRNYVKFIPNVVSIVDQVIQQGHDLVQLSTQREFTELNLRIRNLQEQNEAL